MAACLWILAWCFCGVAGTLLVLRGCVVAGGRLDVDSWFLLGLASVGCSPLLLILGIVVNICPRAFFTKESPA